MQALTFRVCLDDGRGCRVMVYICTCPQSPPEGLRGGYAAKRDKCAVRMMHKMLRGHLASMRSAGTVAMHAVHAIPQGQAVHVRQGQKCKHAALVLPEAGRKPAATMTRNDMLSRMCDRLSQGRPMLSIAAIARLVPGWEFWELF